MPRPRVYLTNAERQAAYRADLKKKEIQRKRQGDYSTPPDLFEHYDRLYHFSLDVCATADNAKCPHYFPPEQDGLLQPWRGTCWMNPPYHQAEIPKWIRKAYEESQRGAVVVALLPVRTGSAWYHEFVLPHAQVTFLRGRIKFAGMTTNAMEDSMIAVFGVPCAQALGPVREADAPCLSPTAVCQRAPFPFFGGKHDIAHVVWERLGPVRHYLEPFAGSLAVLLKRPHPPQIETVNDLDGQITNVWRALAQDPCAVAHYADRPVNELDMHAANRWLLAQQETLTERMRADLHYYDAKAAGLWIWGKSCWIGSGWCESQASHQKPAISHTGFGINRKRPHLFNNGGFVGANTAQGEGLITWFTALSSRLRRVRVLCGDWTRLVTPAALYGSGTPVGIVLDPPYTRQLRHAKLYAHDSDIAGAVRGWAVKYGEDPRVRIALCGLQDEHVMPDTWRVYRWQSRGGWSNSKYHGRASGQPRQECVWFSPGCLPTTQLDFLSAGQACIDGPLPA